MNKSQTLALLALMSLTACGDNSPFDEDYWDDPSATTRNSEEESNRTFTVSLTTLSSANLGEISGTATIAVNDTDSSSTVNLTDVPQSLMVGQRSISNLSCLEIATSFPPPVVVTGSMEFKAVNEVDNSSREALIAELNQADPQNGDSVNLTGKSYVIKAYIENLNTPGPTTAALIPVACGTITESRGDSDQDDESEGTAIGGSGTGTTIGGTTGTTIGGTTTGGATAGTVGGTISDTVGGTIGGTTGGIGGTTGFTTGGTTGATISGSVGGSIGGTVGGTIGGTTGTVTGGTTGF